MGVEKDEPKEEPKDTFTDTLTDPLTDTLTDPYKAIDNDINEDRLVKLKLFSNLSVG